MFGLIPEIARQWPPGLGALSAFALATVEEAFPQIARARALQQFHEVGCRLDREWLDCIVLKTHLEQLSSPVFHRRERLVTFVS